MGGHRLGAGTSYGKSTSRVAVSTVSSKRRIAGGTSERAVAKAMSTYLNSTGAGDYNLPHMTGQKLS